MIFSILSSLIIIEPLIIFRSFFTKIFSAEQIIIQNAQLRIMCILFLNHYAVFMKSLLVY